MGRLSGKLLVAVLRKWVAVGYCNCYEYYRDFELQPGDVWVRSTSLEVAELHYGSTKSFYWEIER